MENINTTGKQQYSQELIYNQINSDSSNQYVTFTVGNEGYGIPILSVQEIVSLPEITKIPNAPDFIQGVINLRGNVIPLIDLRIKFNQGEAKLLENTVVIVTKIEIDEETTKTAGLIVDFVSDVMSFTAENLQDAPEFSSGFNSAFIEKMGKYNDKLVILLKLSALFSKEEFKKIN